jgi:outer membrane protein OmpA-like peptidoglycan-associated protein
MDEGYFSSNREKSIDIFHFRTINPQIFYSSPQRENNYCFSFRDSGSIAIDTLTLQQKWSFGDGTYGSGPVVMHCFPGPGKYTVRLDIVERETGRLFFTKLIDNLDLKDFEQPYINAPDYSVKGDIVSFDGYRSYIPGYSIVNFSWDFGDKIKSSGAKVTHSYLKKGEYVVNLELALKSDSTGSFKKTGVSRKITVLNDKQESNTYQAGLTQMKNVYPDSRKSANLLLKSEYSAEEDFHNDAEFCIELMSSTSKIDLRDGVFRNVPGIYVVKERVDSLLGEYSYTVDQHMSLMATYPSFKKMISLGFRDAKIKMFRLARPYEKELHNFLRVNGTLSDIYFDSSDRLTSNAFIMLDQITRLMNKYPLLKLEVAVHTDNTASPESNLALSQKRSQLLVDYLINRGVKAKRLVSKGYGSSKPIASNLVEKGRKLNRRIDFSVIE